MKQKYKVFINDKEVRFVNISDTEPLGGHQFPETISPAELAANVQASRGNGGVFFVRSHDPASFFGKFVNSFPIINAAGGVVSDETNEQLLMIHRHGKWDLPKGKIDEGENTPDAALREVREECGVDDLKIVSALTETFHMYEYRGKLTIKKTVWFSMRSGDKGPFRPQLEEGITEAKWINKKDIYYLLPATYASIADMLSKKVLNS